MPVVRLRPDETPPLVAPGVKYDLPEQKPQTDAEVQADGIFRAIRDYIQRSLDARTEKIETEFLQLLLGLEKRIDELEKRERR